MEILLLQPPSSWSQKQKKKKKIALQIEMPILNPDYITNICI